MPDRAGLGSYSFERPFQLWAHTVSHSQLLLRSTKGDGRATRVDVVFVNVSAQLVHKNYERPDVRLANDSEQKQIEYLTGLPSTPRTQHFVLEGGPTSFVVAESVAAHEDRGEYFDATRFDVVAPPGLAGPPGSNPEH